jgi:hypothetical protein
MKRDYTQTTARFQKLYRNVQTHRKIFQFGVDMNAECLKDTGRRMDFGYAVGDGLLDNLCELRCRRYRCFSSRLNNPMGNPFRESLFAVPFENVNKDIHWTVVDYLHRCKSGFPLSI